MKPLSRTLGVAVLALALMNASAGLCFCHRGPARPGSAAGAHECCHGPKAPAAATTVSAPASCCHIESVESAATPMAVVHLAPPAIAFTILDTGSPAVDARPHARAVLEGASPPVSILRI